MVKSKDTYNKSKNFRWAVPMSHQMLEILVEEAQLENKPSSTFKHSSFVRVAEAINGKFRLPCEPKHVENHLRTSKDTWGIIMKFRNQKSDFGWDDNLKMIVCDKRSYDEEISAHPSHEKYLKKKIEMYDEMAIVVGKDMATESFAKSFSDIDVEASNEVDSTADSQGNEVEKARKGKQSSSSGPSSKSQSHRKRSRENDSAFDQIAGQLGEVAVAIKKLSDDQVNTENLYKEVMKIEGFDEGFLSTGFDHLNSNTSLAKGFMVKSDNLRRIWIEKFMTQAWCG